MALKHFPIIDLAATGKNIDRLRRERGLTVRDLQRYFGFEEPQAIYKWQQGKSLPSVDHLFALSQLFGVSMNDILVPKNPSPNLSEQQASACCSEHIGVYPFTTLMGFPSSQALALATAMSMMRWRLSLGAQEMWGVMTQFLAVSRGLSGRMGSVDTTSRPAA